MNYLEFKCQNVFADIDEHTIVISAEILNAEVKPEKGKRTRSYCNSLNEDFKP